MIDRINVGDTWRYGDVRKIEGMIDEINAGDT